MTSPLFIPRARLQDLLAALHSAGYRCVGPQVRDGAIVYDTLARASDLPVGVHDHQSPGNYRLTRDASARCFAWANGPQALKPLLFAPVETLWQVERDEAGRLAFRAVVPQPQPVAAIGVRACDLAALRLQDRHFLPDGAQDPAYADRRLALFIIAVDCTHPAATCFCASTGDGPAAGADFDIALSELDEGFLARAGSGAGEAVLDELALQSAMPEQIDAAAAATAAAAAAQVRALPGHNLRDALFARLEHPRWDEVAARCLACGNCTSACPTCFCYREQDESRLDAGASTHVRLWDSCFTPGHSYIHGLTVRASTRLRYRQWLTHKLGAWHDQYDRSGCVGCGRCITWCPVGIDITEEAAAICGDRSLTDGFED